MVATAASTTITIDLEDGLQRRRYGCPRGHRSWERTDGHFWCQRCAASWDVDPEFYELIDLTTREPIHRDRIEFLEYKATE